ncbi:MAG: HNH endonuclease [Candidatus Parabeggiatoa sp. nov. 1]|nr:MAG: HNH endonuclease [Gammaproteobacteria bacterium]
MQKVFVLDVKKMPLMPCHPARARELLNKGRAAVYKRYPFTIILKDRVGGDVQPVELKFDPGSKTTGIALVGHFERGLEIVFGANLNHRGQKIKQDLESRRANRRGRRNRKTRYRPSRFNNRCRSEGWLPPSLMSRVFNVETWAERLQSLIPITSIAVETVRFDTQKMLNSKVSGVEYQQGELAGYEVREYLLEKWGRKCAYCGAENIPLEIEHIQPKSKGGSNRISNLTIACVRCNQKKGNKSIENFLKRKPIILKRIKAQTKKSLKDTAAVNATRYAIGNALKTFDLPVTFWSGGRTKFNRTQQKYTKDHWIDAACVGETGAKVYIPNTLKPLTITAVGHGSRQMCRVDQYGFPRTTAKKQKVVKGFQTGDIVKAVVTKGKKIGTYIGRVAIRASGSFNISTKNGTTQGISWKYCQRIQAVDGYNYFT